MQQIIEIPFKGVTTSPSDYDCSDGELSFTSGLTNTNGSYQPLPTAKKTDIHIPYGYKLVYIHQTTTLKKIYILQNETSGKVTYMIDGSIAAKTWTDAEKNALYASLVVDKQNSMRNCQDYITNLQSQIDDIDSGKYTDISEHATNLHQMMTDIESLGFVSALQKYDDTHSEDHAVIWNNATDVEKYELLKSEDYDACLQSAQTNLEIDVYNPVRWLSETSIGRFVVYKTDNYWHIVSSDFEYIVEYDEASYLYYISRNEDGSISREMEEGETYDSAETEQAKDTHTRVCKIIEDLTLYKSLYTMWDTITAKIDTYYEDYQAVKYDGDGSAELRAELVAKKSAAETQLATYTQEYNDAVAEYEAKIANTSVILSDSLNSVTSLGNVLVITTDEPVKNWIFKDGEYLDFTLPDDIGIKFGLSGSYNTEYYPKLLRYDQISQGKTDYSYIEDGVITSLGIFNEGIVSDGGYGLRFESFKIKSNSGFKSDTLYKFYFTCYSANSGGYALQAYLPMNETEAAKTIPATFNAWNNLKLYSYRPSKYYSFKATKNYADSDDRKYKYDVEVTFTPRVDCDTIIICLASYNVIQAKPTVSIYNNMSCLFYVGNVVSFAYIVDPDDIQVLHGKIQEFINSYGTSKNKFTYPFLVRYGYELFDGTIAYASAPIMMIPNSTTTPIAGIVDIGSLPSGQTKSDYNNVRMGGMFCDMYMQIYDNAKLQSLIAAKDIVKKLVIAITPEIWRYDTSFVDADSKHLGVNEGMSSDNISFCTYGDSVIPSAHKELDLFAESITDDVHDMYNIEIPALTDSNYRKSIEASGTFYIIKSINVDELEYGETKIEFEENDLKTITNKRVMDTSNLTYNQKVAVQAMVYNNRLNLVNVSEIKFKGWNPADMLCLSSDASIDKTITTKYALSIDMSFDDQEYNAIVPFGDSTSTPACWMFLPYKPNKVTVYRKTVTVNSDYTTTTELAKCDAEFVEHPLLDGYYLFVSDYADLPFNFVHSYVGDGGTDDEECKALIETLSTESADVVVNYPNKLYLSNVSDPISFNLANVTYVSDGEILAISSANRPISEGQFGQFPLYCFTTHGVWAMEVATDGTYSAPKPLTRDVCTNVNSITQLDSAVVFVTARGLMLLSGGQSQCLTENLADGTEIDLPLSLLGGTDVDITLNPKQLLQECRIVYDYPNTRLICYGDMDKYPYAMVYSFKTQSWSYIKNDIAYSLVSYPETLVIGTDNYLRDMASTEVADTTTGIIATRAFRICDVDYKTLNELRVNGVFNYSKMNTLIQVSNDLLNWVSVGSSLNNNAVLNRAGSAYRFFRLIIIAKLSPSHSLSSFSVKYTTKDDANLVGH